MWRHRTLLFPSKAVSISHVSGKSSFFSLQWVQFLCVSQQQYIGGHSSASPENTTPLLSSCLHGPENESTWTPTPETIWRVIPSDFCHISFSFPSLSAQPLLYYDTQNLSYEYNTVTFWTYTFIQLLFLPTICWYHRRLLGLRSYISWFSLP